MTTLEILKAARKLLSKSEQWTQGHAARSRQGRPVSYMDADAVCFCSWGAIGHESPTTADRDETVQALGYSPYHTPQLFDWNDAPGRTHAEVLARFDEAIKRLEARP